MREVSRRGLRVAAPGQRARAPRGQRARAARRGAAAREQHCGQLLETAHLERTVTELIICV